MIEELNSLLMLVQTMKVI
ncbi:hypothetical protein Gotur_015901, partial [Gossypium turneri]